MYHNSVWHSLLLIHINKSVKSLVVHMREDIQKKLSLAVESLRKNTLLSKKIIDEKK